MSSHSDVVYAFKKMKHLTNEKEINELLISEEEIDENDTDFKYILKCLIESSEATEQNDPKSIKCNEYKAIANTPKLQKLSEDQQSFDNYDLSYSEYPDFSKIPKGNETKNKGRTRETFPVKLFKILERADVGGYNNIISWQSHGRAFKIHDVDQFGKHIMKKYFLQMHLKSFKHQLYTYGFRKSDKRVAESGIYFHELFIRGRLDLCSTIERLKGVRSTFIITPNFNLMPRISASQGNTEGLDEPKVVQYGISDDGPLC